MNSVVFSILVLAVTSAYGRMCLPPQFQATLDLAGMVDTNGMSISQMGTIILYSDNSLKKAAYDINLTTGTYPTVMKAIEDHSVSPAVRYEFTSTNCTKKAPMFDFEPYCIPDGAQKIGSTIIGDPMYGQNVTVYTYSSGSVLAGRIAMSPNNIPVVQEQTIAYPGSKISQTLVYYDVKTSISDPSVFDIPAMCQHKHTLGVIIGKK